MKRLMGRTLVLIFLLARLAPADDSALSLADLEAYRVALSAKTSDSAPVVRFRDLWTRPEAYVGRPVRVEGRVVRLFRQPRMGDFPPLVEAWIVSPAGDPFCLVFSQGKGRMAPEVGASVQFSGTFLRKIRYHGGDAPRLAPLIVGPDSPSPAPETSGLDGSSWSTVEWVMGLGALAAVALVLARKHLSRPLVGAATFDPPPIFVDGEAGSDPDDEGNFHEGS